MENNNWAFTFEEPQRKSKKFDALRSAIQSLPFDRWAKTPLPCDRVGAEGYRQDAIKFCKSMGYSVKTQLITNEKSEPYLYILKTRVEAGV